MPDKWEDLFNLTVPEWKTEILYATTKNNIKNMEFEKNRIESNRLHEENYRFSGLNKNVMMKVTIIIMKAIKRLWIKKLY